MNDSSLELDDTTHAAITRHCAAGDKLAEAQRWKVALLEYAKAWQLIPEPKNAWEAATWVLAAIADSCFFLGDFVEARKALEYAMVSPGGLGNPFLHLRLGQCQLELGMEDRAADELTRAYMGAGKDIFAVEDPKYFEFLKTKILPPVTGEW